MERRDGDFADFFAARGPGLRRVAYAIVHDWAEAEEAVQAAFVKVYVRWDRVQRASADAYIRRAVVNESISRLRRRRREVVTDEIPELFRGADTPPVDPIPAALALVPPSQRAIIALRFVDDLSVAEVSEALGITEGAVKSQTARGLSKLRAHLAALEPESKETWS